MLTIFIDALMSAEVDAVCGAGDDESSQGRANVRNGCRHRDLDTHAGTLDVAIPKRARSSTILRQQHGITTSQTPPYGPGARARIGGR